MKIYVSKRTSQPGPQAHFSLDSNMAEDPTEHYVKTFAHQHGSCSMVRKTTGEKCSEISTVVSKRSCCRCTVAEKRRSHSALFCHRSLYIKTKGTNFEEIASGK
ncbi:hypothetical protein AVEN_54670-1 [Araneus ventricosus]|uniref:Uncharacterized protein n=1 Tax=Araneus ventricosus TaxID=182803 RepID=A0A4Y2BM61_ARAVE|nr:hypothetical protein AVEN_54670-1 [Araneus ventricosus]